MKEDDSGHRQWGCTAFFSCIAVFLASGVYLHWSEYPKAIALLTSSILLLGFVIINIVFSPPLIYVRKYADGKLILWSVFLYMLWQSVPLIRNAKWGHLAGLRALYHGYPLGFEVEYYLRYGIIGCQFGDWECWYRLCFYQLLSFAVFGGVLYVLLFNFKYNILRAE